MAENLFNNKLFIQYLSAAGQDIASGRPLSDSVNAVTQQNISAQNYTGLLQKMLAGGGKVTMDNQNISFKAPMTALSGQNVETNANAGTPGGVQSIGSPAVQASREQQPKPARQTGQATSAQLDQVSQADVLSQLLSGNLANTGTSQSVADALAGLQPSDLAGVTPEMINQGIAFRGQMDAADRKSALEIAKLENQFGNVDRFPIPVPGLGQVSLDQWKSLDTDTKTYSSYVAMQKATNPNEPIKSFDEWKHVPRETKLDYIRGLYENPELLETVKQMKGPLVQIDTGAKVAEKRATSFVDFENKLPNMVQEYLSSDNVQQKLFDYEPGTPQAKKVKATEAAKFIESQIRSRGRIIDTKISPEGIGTWKIKTKSGNVETISYALYD